MKTAASPRRTNRTQVGDLLREWRAARRLSQFDLALEAGLSARHLSCLETGKSQPSREMISRLADTLDMPLRERNALLIAAGFAPTFPETALATPQLAPVRHAIDAILRQQEPFPAYLLSRHWDILAANRAAERVSRFCLDGRDSPHRNIMRQFFDPQDLRSAITNWEEVAGDLIRHLHAESAAAPTDVQARALLQEMLAYPGVPARWRTRALDTPLAPLLTTVFRHRGQELNFFSAITTFATPRDVTVAEVRIESVFPSDEATAEFCRRLAAEEVVPLASSGL